MVSTSNIYVDYTKSDTPTHNTYTVAEPNVLLSTRWWKWRFAVTKASSSSLWKLIKKNTFFNWNILIFHNGIVSIMAFILQMDAVSYNKGFHSAHALLLLKHYYCLMRLSVLVTTQTCRVCSIWRVNILVLVRHQNIVLCMMVSITHIIYSRLFQLFTKIKTILVRPSQIHD